MKKTSQSRGVRSTTKTAAKPQSRRAGKPAKNTYAPAPKLKAGAKSKAVPKKTAPKPKAAEVATLGASISTVLPNAPAAPVPPLVPAGAIPGTPQSPPEPTHVLAWEDDPESEGAAPVRIPVPGDPLTRWQLNLIGHAPEAAEYPVGTPEFRYWTARAALVRCRDFWRDVSDDLGLSDIAWQTGSQLPVTLDAGVQLNAYYTPWNGLTFYHDVVDGQEIHVAESADIASHELGHAVLDALQPAIYRALLHETAAFHEAFGDISALLAGLQQRSLCEHVLGRHGGWIERDSRWTRIGEALGKAIHRRSPDRASDVCLRNAANVLFYRKPVELPVSGPDYLVTQEPHSLARPFIGAFLEALAAIARADASTVTVASVQGTARKAAGWLVAATLLSPVQADYFFQVASSLTAQAVHAGDAEARDAIAGAFVRRGILPIEALDDSWPQNPKTLPADTGTIPVPLAPGAPLATRGFAALGALAMAPAGPGAPAAPTPSILDGRRFGLKSGDPIRLPEPSEAFRHRESETFSAGLRRTRSGLPALGAVGAAAAAPPLVAAAASGPAQLQHEESFLHYLFQRGRVEFAPDTVSLAATGPVAARKTHRLLRKDGMLTLERIAFDCGFD